MKMEKLYFRNYIDNHYKLLKKFNKMCDNENIHYVGTCGSLLGAVRNSGMIPYDDDIDVCILKKASKKIIKYAKKYKMCVLKCGLGLRIFNNENPNCLPFKLSFIDIFYLDKIDDELYFSAPYDNNKPSFLTAHLFPNNQYKRKDFMNRKKYKFGTEYIYLPNNAKYYCEQFYGSDWRTPYKKDFNVNFFKLMIRHDLNAFYGFENMCEFEKQISYYLTILHNPNLVDKTIYNTYIDVAIILYKAFNPFLPHTLGTRENMTHYFKHNYLKKIYKNKKLGKKEHNIAMDTMFNMIYFKNYLKSFQKLK